MLKRCHGLAPLLSQHLASLCFIHPSWGPDQDQASSHDMYCLPTTFFAAGISAEKSVSMCLEGHISSCFRACLCISTESSLFFPLTSLTKWETIHIVFGLLFVVALLILNLTFFIFCSSLFQDCFKLLSMSLPFFSFTLHYSSVLPVS